MKLFINLLLIFSLLSCSKEDSITPPLEQNNSPFVLPYQVGKSYSCMQGWNGNISHFGSFQYAVDFSMPIGTEITCSRDGVVDYLIESYYDTDFGVGKENLVIVRHDDNTFARYVHLTHNGALVEINQSVKKGDVIGLSGNSGQSYAPHLHFDVTRDGNTRESQTIKFYFRNTLPHPEGLIAGKIYTANSYRSHSLVH